VSDVNRDGRRDLSFHFRFGETGFSCTDIPPGRTAVNLMGILTGLTKEGPPFEGTDALRLVTSQ
jgi:hypothetical protein